MRTSVTVSDEKIKILDEIAEIRDVSRASLISKAIDDYIQQHSYEAIKPMFGIFKGQLKDGVEYQREMRDEWDD